MPVPQTVEEKNITPRVNGFSYGTVSLILFVSLAATALCVRSRGLKKKKGGYFVIYGLGLLSLLCVGVFHHSMMDDSLQQIISDLPVENSGNYIDNKNSIFYNTIELLFMGNKTLASEYLAKNPFENFKVRMHGTRDENGCNYHTYSTHSKISTTHTTCPLEWLPLMKLQIAWKTVAMGKNVLRLIISRSSC